MGQSAKLWKVVTIDGVEQEREVVNTSKYSSSPKIIAVGNVSDDPNACAAINAAIATQDEATVRAVAAQCAAGAAPAAPATTDPAAGATPEAPATTDPAAGVTPEAPATTDPAAGATPEAPVTTDPAAGTTPVQ